MSTYIHYHTQIPDPLVVLSLGLLKRYNQQWSHIAHVRPIRTLQNDRKISITGCLCIIGVNSVEQEIL